MFCELLKQAIISTQNKGCDTLLVVGGSSFYLKSIIDGLSPLPNLDAKTKEEIQNKILSLKNPLEFLHNIESSLPFLPKDQYRIQKYLEIYFSTGLPPSVYFQKNPKIPFAFPIEKYALTLPREALRERIFLRSQKMLDLGIIAETQFLLEKYGEEIQPFSSIGLKECKDYLQGKITSKDDLLSLISIHTSQLAKRQSTFNRTQFGIPLPLKQVTSIKDYALSNIVEGEYEELLEHI